MKARMSESRLSRLSTGLFEPKDAEKQALSIVLNVPVDILFPLISRRFENKERKDGR